MSDSTFDDLRERVERAASCEDCATLKAAFEADHADSETFNVYSAHILGHIWAVQQERTVINGRRDLLINQLARNVQRLEALLGKA